MQIKRIFIITSISLFMFAFLWVGHTTLTSAADLQSNSPSKINIHANNFIANTLAATINWDDVTKLSASDATVNNRFGYNMAPASPLIH